MRDYDAVVAGAGPAGSLAALLLARAGKRVALLDKARFPRPKACGDCVSPRTGALWRELGLAAGFAALPHRAVEEIVLEADGVPFHRSPVPGAPGAFRAVDRAILDAWLLGEVHAAGAEVREGTAVRAVRPDGTVETEGEPLRAALVIGADGRNSLVGQQAGLLPPARRCHRIGWQLALGGLPADGTLRMNVFREGYYGLVDTGGETRNCALVLDGRLGARPEEVVARYLPGARVEAKRSVAPISRAPAEPARGRVRLVGDAARVVEPFTGEGIHFALASAVLAARAPDAARYRSAHRRLYRDGLALNRLARLLLAGEFSRRRLVPRLRHAPALVESLIARLLG